MREKKEVELAGDGTMVKFKQSVTALDASDKPITWRFLPSRRPFTSREVDKLRFTTKPRHSRNLYGFAQGSYPRETYGTSKDCLSWFHSAPEHSTKSTSSIWTTTTMTTSPSSLGRPRLLLWMSTHTIPRNTTNMFQATKPQSASLSTQGYPLATKDSRC